MFKTKKKKLILAFSLMLLSAVLLSTASFAWFAMNTKTNANDFKVEAYSDSLFLQISDTGATTGFTTTPLSYSTNDTEDLRLVTHKVIAATDSVYSAVTTATASGYYDATTHTGNYYKLADSDAEGATTSTVFNYILATTAAGDLKEGSALTGYFKNVKFVLQTTGNGDDTTVYYEKVGADYNIVTPTPTSTDSIKGYYKIDGTYTALTSSDKFSETDVTANNIYWQTDTSGNYSKVTGLVPGTDMSQFYTITTTSAETSGKFDGTTTYYVKSDNDYICIGKPAKDTPITGYIYWGRAYSSAVDAVQETNTLNVLSPDVANQDYYLTKTLYLRQGDGTNHADNLRVSDVELAGATNALNPALRVLFVATSSTDPSTVVTTVYDAGTDKFDGTATEGQLFDTLLGDEQEVITVDVYIYFDGTDEVAMNTTLNGVLNGQSVSIEFSIDELDYNEISSN